MKDDHNILILKIGNAETYVHTAVWVLSPCCWGQDASTACPEHRGSALLRDLRLGAVGAAGVTGLAELLQGGSLMGLVSGTNRIGPFLI